jgi:RimJ/RimL family protein N-acetyltransferase
MPLPPTIKTTRLTLRVFSESDVPPHAQMCANRVCSRFLGNGEPLTDRQAWEQMAAFIGHWQLRGYGMWAIEETATGVFLGRAGLVCPPDWPGVQVSWLFGRSAWGRGIEYEALVEVLRYAHKEQSVDSVLAFVHPDDFPSEQIVLQLRGKRAETVKLHGTSWTTHHLPSGA